MNNKNEIFIPCGCGNEIIRLTKWKDEEDYYLSIYSYYSDKYSLWGRLKILFGGKVKTSEVVLSREDFEKLRQF